MRRIAVVLVALFAALVALAVPVKANTLFFSPGPPPIPLTNQYTVSVATENLGPDSWKFTYAITNNTEGVGPGVPNSGLDGFRILIPKYIELSPGRCPPPTVTLPEPYRETTVDPGWWDLNRWDFGDGVYDVLQIWGQEAASVYPPGSTLTFSLQLDNVGVGNNVAGLISFYLDRCLAHPSDPNAWFVNYSTELISPVAQRRPVVDAGGPYRVAEGSDITVTALGTDADGDTLSYAWDFDSDGIFEVSSQDAAFHAVDGPVSQVISVQATDEHGSSTTDTAVMTIDNQSPSVGLISIPVDPAMINTSITSKATFTDPGVLDTHIAVWDWGDGLTDFGAVVETDGFGSVTGSHIYITPGIYTISLVAMDKDNALGSSVADSFVVVYDPNASIVIGGGWIDSPTGAYAKDTTLTGKANFGFVSKYQKGATVPTGNTEFQFKVGDLNFKSTSYEWLVVAGARAQFKGSGTINGARDYGFMLTAVDGQISGGGGIDKFRIKIWDKTNDSVIYDNQIGVSDTGDLTTTLGGGSIVIHK